MEETLNKLREVAELQQAATPGPWDRRSNGWIYDSVSLQAFPLVQGRDGGFRVADSLFIEGCTTLDLADVVRAVESVQQSEQHASEQNLAWQQAVLTIQGRLNKLRNETDREGDAEGRGQIAALSWVIQQLATLSQETEVASA